MQVVKKSLFALMLGLFAGQAMAAGLVVENKTNHKIEPKKVHDPDGGPTFGYAFSVDTKKVIPIEMAFMLEILKEEAGDETADELKELNQVLDSFPMFLGEENQKIVFSFNEELCAKGAIAAQVNVQGETTTFCLANDPKIENGNVYFFANPDMYSDPSGSRR